MPSKYAFRDRAHLLKDERERARTNIQEFCEFMQSQNPAGVGNGLEIRVKGNAFHILHLVDRLEEAGWKAKTVTRLLHDRHGDQHDPTNIDSANLMAYLVVDPAKVPADPKFYNPHPTA